MNWMSFMLSNGKSGQPQNVRDMPKTDKAKVLKYIFADSCFAHERMLQYTFT